MAFNWTCPHCDRDQAVADSHHHQQVIHLGLPRLPEGRQGYQALAIQCANADCEKLSFAFRLGQIKIVRDNWVPDLSVPPLYAGRLYPAPTGKMQPDYIPVAIREDYSEACAIKELSPKSSATLARRALQGMIRNFCGISRGTLNAEIKALEAAIDDGTAPRAVSVESVQAIDHVRRVGNIGAHMERDINEIINVDPGEAQALIELVELLMREWYVDRHLRQERLAAVAAIRAEKDQAKLDFKEAKALPLPDGT